VVIVGGKGEADMIIRDSSVSEGANPTADE
jgi:hypothetical protein